MCIYADPCRETRKTRKATLRGEESVDRSISAKSETRLSERRIALIVYSTESDEEEHRRTLVVTSARLPVIKPE